MRLNCKVLRRVPKLEHHGVYGVCAAILSVSAIQPLHAADRSDGAKAYVLSENKSSNANARVFSKDKPLFGSQNAIPSVTPDRSGRTKVKVIVRPGVPSTRDSSSKRARQSEPLGAALKSPYESSAKVQQEDRRSKRNPDGPTKPVPSQIDVVRDQSPTTNVVTGERRRSDEVFSRVMKQEQRPEYKPSRAQVSGVLLPIPKPGARSTYRARSASVVDSDNKRKQANPKVKVSKRLRHRARRRPDARRSNYRRLRHSRKRWQQRRRARRVARWRRNAPPGTVNSFVRCWPGEPCVRYYRVRRPRTLRQYRRLMAWQRRQDARLRYRRYYRRY